MTSIYMIFTALATTALAKGSAECNFSEHTGAWCSGAVGQLLLFHLPHTANTEIKLMKDKKYVIFKKGINQKVTLHEEYVNQAQLFINGTFKLGNAMKKHSGDYQLEEFGSDGKSLKKVSVQLEIQAPVSKPAVSQMCLSPEQMKLSCSSEGDDVDFSLTLDGHSLMQTRGQTNWKANMQSLAGSATKQDKMSISNINIILYGQLTGNATCHVWNNVSRDETVIHLKSCKDFSSFPFAAVIAGFVTLVLLVTLGLGIRHLQNKQRPRNINAGNAEEMSDIIYSDVRVRQKTRTTRPNSQNAT